MNEKEAHSAVNHDASRADDSVGEQIKKELVDANHILFNEGVVDAFGHVSVRHPECKDRFLLSRNLAPRLVTVDDILTFDLDSEPTPATEQKVYLERFIHGEIYRARPDINAVVHSHSPSVVPFSVVPSAPIKPICHMSGFLGEGAPIFEIRDVANDATDLLISNRRLGVALVDVLGSGSTVLMRGHGSTVVADTIRKAVYRAVYLEVNARLQSEAQNLGPVTFLTEAEAATARDTNEQQVARPWALWKERAQKMLGTVGQAKAD